MKKLSAVTLAVVGLLALTACGSTGTPQATVTHTVTVVETPDPAPVDVSLGSSSDMVNMIQAQDSMFLEVDDATIITVAQSVCDALRNGASVTDVGAVATESIGSDHAAALIAGAILYLCPDQKYLIN